MLLRFAHQVLRGSWMHLLVLMILLFCHLRTVVLLMGRLFVMLYFFCTGGISIGSICS